MHRAKRVTVVLGASCVLATWAGSAQAPSIGDQARAALAQVAHGRGPSELAARGVRDAFEEVGVVNPAGQVVIALAPDDVGDGIVAVANRLSAPKAGILVSEQDAGQVAVFNTAGAPRFVLDGNAGLLSMPGDVAEKFPSTAQAVAEGSVMSIDPDRPGSLRVASQPYDRRVAGIVSGARDYRPGITLNAGGAANHVTVTLTGTVYCLVTGANGRVRAGDLLTSSAEPGHAMRAGDADAARGAIIGKALETLEGERGLVLTLASLQ